jgi:hypothetical protein
MSAKKRPPRFEAYAAVLDDPELTSVDLHVYMLIDDYAGERSKCTAHQDTLARRARISRSALQRSLRRLMARQHLDRKRGQNGNSYIPAWRRDLNVSSETHRKAVPSITGEASGAPHMMPPYKEEPQFEPQTKFLTTTAAAVSIEQQVQSGLVNNFFPKTKAAMQDFGFPPAGQLLPEVVRRCKERCVAAGKTPDIVTDEFLAQGVRESTKLNQQTAGLYRDTLPAWVESQLRDNPGERKPVQRTRPKWADEAFIKRAGHL